MSTKLLEAVVAEALAFAANAPTDVQLSLSRLLAILQKPVVDILHLRACVLAQGLPPQSFCAPSLRALVWRLLLGILPPVRSEWKSHLDSKRATYEKYVFELVHEPEEITYLRCGVSPNSNRARDEGFSGDVERVPALDHPLALPDSPSRWRRYWSDQEIFDQVNKDVFRTRPELKFFSHESDPQMNGVTVRGDAVTHSLIAMEQPTSPKSQPFAVANIIAPKSHYDRICRILFLYAKLNFGYVQGMNELVAPLYYTFYHDVVEGHFVEADCFFALSAVMQEQRDIFCKSLDDSSIGMNARLGVIEDLLEQIDPAVGAHVKNLGVKMDYFALRWILLLFAQEFDIHAVQILWDSLFSDQTLSVKSYPKQNLLVHFIAVAMIVKVREAILAGDFTDVMRTLQRYPPFDPRELVLAGMALRRGRKTSTDDLVQSVAPELLGTDLPHPRKVSIKVTKPSFTSKLVNLVRRRKASS